MIGFKIITETGIEIKFIYYTKEAPVTSQAFDRILPFTRTFYHARISGQEIWFDDLTRLDIIQENASVFTLPGEVVLGPSRPARLKTANCLGIYYGEGRGLDACNIFAKAVETDMDKLRELGNSIWKNGSQKLVITALEE